MEVFFFFRLFFSFSLSSTSREGKGLNAMNRDWDDFTNNEQVPWSVYHTTPTPDIPVLTLTLRVLDQIPISGFFFYSKSKSVLNAQQIFRKCIFIRLTENIFKLKSK